MEGNAELLQSPEKATSKVEWAKENLLNPMLNAGPLAVYNIAADAVSLPTVHLTQAEAAPYSANWFAQGLSGGIGSALPFMLAGAGAKYALNAAGTAVADTAIGATLKPILMNETVGMVTGAALFGALQKPDETHTRLGNAVGMGVGMIAFAKGNALTSNFSTLGKLAALPAIGFAGGVTMAEVSQLASNGKFADNDIALQSGVQGMAMNTVMGFAQRALEKDSARAQEQTVKNMVKEIEKIDPEAKGMQVMTSDGKIARAATGDVSKLVEQSRAYSEWVRENKPQYPTVEEFGNLTKDQIAQRGFLHPDLQKLEIADMLEAFKDKKPRPLPDAKVVAAEVRKAVADMPLAGAKGPLIMGEWNMEFLTADKAKYFAETYKEVVPRHHLLFVIETDAPGLAQVAKDNGYQSRVSAANTRGQAVGFLAHERLQINGTKSYDSVANVKGIPDLRPAFRLDFTDKATGDNASAIVVHLKSMRGGPEQTAAIRTLQASVLAKELEPNFKGVIAGDFNTFLDKTNQMDPLVKAGFKLLNPGDASTTQSMGGRLDGFFTKNMPEMSDPTVKPFFKNPLVTRGLSDHALLSTQLKTGTGR